MHFAVEQDVKAAGLGGSRGIRWNSWGRSGIGAVATTRCLKGKLLAMV